MEQPLSSSPGEPQAQARSRNAELVYLLFIFTTVVARSCEAGVISSSMPEIKLDLRLSYTQEGTLAASPDYGMIPGAILAGSIFRRTEPHSVLQIGYFYIAFCSMACALNPSLVALLLTRSTCSFMWCMAIVHYPVWINSVGSTEGRSRMLALPSIGILFGIVVGYTCGGEAESYGLSTWTQLYAGCAAIMFGCAVWSLFFPASLVNDVSSADTGLSMGTQQLEDNERQPLLDVRRDSGGMLPQAVLALCSSRLYIAIVMSAASVSGAAGFCLYFFADFGLAVTTWNEEQLEMIAGMVMFSAALSGTVLGAEWLTWIGGYHNYSKAIFIILVSGFGVLFSSIMLKIGTVADHPDYWIVGGFFGILFFGSIPTSAYNGIAVSIIPDSAHYASGLMFAGLHFSKFAVPSIGGIVIDRFGIGNGFASVVMTMGGLMAVSGVVAYFAVLAETGPAAKK